MSFEPMFKTLVEIYEKSTDRHPHRPLFGEKKGGRWVWSTYGDFRATTDAFRGGLAALGIGRGDVVAMIANNRPEWATAAYATYGLGASFAPMYEAQHDEEWEYILADSGTKLLCVPSQAIADRVQAFRTRLPELLHVVTIEGTADHSFADVVALGKRSPVALVHPQPDDLAGFIYTSGTTGNPKGVLLTHKNLASNVSAIQDLFPIGPEDRSLSFLPWAHSFGQVVELHGLFSMGASMGIAEAVDKIVDNLAEVEPTLLFAVPRIFNRIYRGLKQRMAEEGGIRKMLFDAAIENEQQRRRLAEQKQSSLFVELKHALFDRLVFAQVRARFGGKLKYAFSGGAAISREVAEFIDDLGIMVYEGYGLTETSPIVTANWPGTRRLGSVGKPIPGVRVDIDRTVTGDSVDGEIVVHGHNVMKGYHRLPEENAKVFTPDGGLRTGDMGHLDGDGFLYITGRIKEQYKLENGKYVVPTLLEEEIKLSPYVSNVMVYGDNKPFNVALVVPDMENLSKWAAEHAAGLTEAELLADARVRELIQSEIEQRSGRFKQFEKVRKVALVAEDFTQENGLLTPSLKLKRCAVLHKHGSALAELYA
ncbi:MAG: long-chain fatty acid--CoA ligase [Thermodesulfobacteriota bacterium]